LFSTNPSTSELRFPESVDSESVVVELDQESEDPMTTSEYKKEFSICCSDCSSSFSPGAVTVFCDFKVFVLLFVGAHVNANINIVARRPVRTVTMNEGVRVDCLQGF
jgi:hypothetical protein